MYTQMAASMKLSSRVGNMDTLNSVSRRLGLPAVSPTKSLPQSTFCGEKHNCNLSATCCPRSSSVASDVRALLEHKSAKNFSKNGRLSPQPRALPEHSIPGVLDIQVVPDVQVTPTSIQSRPDWWPNGGTNFIDLDLHDLPHEKATLEWWYVNTHFSTKDDRQFSLFASFFRSGEPDKETGEISVHRHSITWGVTDVSKKSYSYHTLLDPSAPKKALEMLESFQDEEVDPLLRRAVLEMYKKGGVPLPDRLMQQDAYVSNSRLELEYEGNRFEKTSDGRYRVSLLNQDELMGVELTFDPQTPPIRHGDEGVVSAGPQDEGMFYYFMPNCKVEGKIILDGKIEAVHRASGWYDHEFGRPDSDALLRDGVAWNWLSAQLNNGYQITAYDLFNVHDTSVATGSYVVIIDPAGTSRHYKHFVLKPVEGAATWTSMRTFVEYPVAWELRIPAAKISLRGEAMELPAQEYITSLSSPAFWEGRVNVTGVFNGEWVSGQGFVERAGFRKTTTLKDFFKAVTKETLKAVHKLLPLPVTDEDLVRLIGIKSMPHMIAGVDREQFASTIIKPIRDVIDRSGKCWRSYASIASIDVIGQMLDIPSESLAYAELMHVGSLIIDDVQDKSTIRRGQPTCHQIYGQALAINAGSICYFLAQLVKDIEVQGDDKEKVQMYDLFFETMRAAHAGQALDIDGFQSLMPTVVEHGSWAAEELERRVLTVHLLKSGTPCAALGRSGAQRGGGTPKQVEAVGNFYQAIGVAFQIVDDVLNLRGFEGNLKQKGEDLACGKITMPVAKAMSRLSRESRQSVWDIISSKPTDPSVIDLVIKQLEDCGAVQECANQASEIVEVAWRKLDPLVPDGHTKILLRAFSWYILERYY